MERFVIIGAGLAGAKTAEHLRAQGFDGAITLIGEEPLHPYERPPLSKGILKGTADAESAFVHDPQWYTENAVELLLDTQVTGIDLDDRRVQLPSGDLDFTKLALTTGARPRHLDIPGADLSGVHYLRRLPEAERLREVFAEVGRIVVVGAGWIGLEVAAAARESGVDVTVVEAAELPLLNVLGPRMAEVFAQVHRSHGVALELGVGVESFVGTDRVAAVRLSDGRNLAADAVVVGVGVVPNVEPAAGLTIDNGVLTDEHLRTSHPDVFAAGDVANAFHPVLGRHIRVEHWANALNQPAVAAAGMLGNEAVYDRLPYFYTDQFDLGMEYVGYADGGAEVVVRGSGLEFIAFWLREGRVAAGMNVNVWDVVEPIRELILSGREVDPSRLADPEVSLDEV
ncbi:MAG: FAD-dependent oxidoreductase [Actinobacteria bacterium]|nr:FAD-dependent oxidoreductase [Actinomycetota bacterium]MCB9415116.1 FAD-dependent oxidoreductase [Actinomycetota bacterium]MCB9425303.1 FAD-dependent oxidoreductase [Actinomycetota bacterium]